MVELKTYNVTLNSSGYKNIRGTRINIGGALYVPAETSPAFYYFVIVDRASGNVVKDHMVNSVTPPSMLPVDLQEYNDSKYIWLFVTGNLGVTCFPTGQLYNFFIERLGAAGGFQAFMQVVQQGQDTGLDIFCYALAAVPGEPGNSIESYYVGSNPYHNTALIIQLEPRATKDKKEWLTPVKKVSAAG